MAAQLELARLWWTRHGPLPASLVAEQRLQALVAYARSRSAFYAARYRHLPRGRLPLAALPPVTRAELMGRFDEWCTDPRVRRRSVQHFLASRDNIGAAFLGEYGVWKSSGSSGEPGLFVHDAGALAVYDALVAAHLGRCRWSAQGAARVAAGGARAALVVATGDHFASIASWQRIVRAVPGLDAKSFSVMDPLDTLAARLDAFAPAFVASYPSVLGLLAEARESGRLRLAPALLWSGGEHLASAARAALERAFGCPVMNEYGASECLAIAAGCRHGWLHVNAEWVILEPVERDGTPTPPGRISHGVLLTNLANRVQPLIRYDLGDRIELASAACACGDAMPAIRVEGRTDDTLALRAADGRLVRLPPLAIATAVEEVAGVHRFQVAQTAQQALVLRISPGTGCARLRARALAALRRHLARHSLGNVTLSLDDSPPRVDRASGKLRSVVREHSAGG